METPETLRATISPASSSSAAARIGPGGVGGLAYGKLLHPAVGRAAQQPHPRSAHRAGVGLGVKAPVGWVLVLAPAGRAEREAAHRRALAVVGQVSMIVNRGPQLVQLVNG